MKRATLLVTLLSSLILIPGCAKEQSAPGTSQTGEQTSAIAWGEPTNGLQAGLSLNGVGNGPRVFATLILHLRNVSTSPIRLLRLSARKNMWGQRLPLEVLIDGDLIRYQGPVLDPNTVLITRDYIYLEPDETDSVTVPFYPENWKTTAPFDAELAFVFENHSPENRTVGPYNSETRTWSTVSNLWTGKVLSRSVHLKMDL